MGKQVYEMQNFVKLTKAKSNVGPKPKRDDWKRDRTTARKTKVTMQRGITDYKSKRNA
jgi:hypothetical protein